jgi:hypothetical protein
VNWYVAPVCTVDPEFGYHPGEGDGSVCPGLIPGTVVHAYDPDPRVVVSDPDPNVVGDAVYQVPTTCLVGSPNDESARAGWVAKTLAEAQAHYLAITGTTPLATEVY